MPAPVSHKGELRGRGASRRRWGSAGEGMIFVAENRDFRHEK